MKRLLAGAVRALAVLLIGAAAASASTMRAAVNERNAASTKAYIALQELSDTSAIRAASAVKAAENAVVGQARAGCSNVLEGAPKKPNSRQSQAIAHVLTEALLVLDLRQLAPLHGISVRIGREQQRLRFSDAALQWQVDVGGSALGAFVDLQPPGLCTDARALAASHFTRLTAAGTRFVTDASTLYPQAAAAPAGLLRLMRPYAPDAVSVGLKRLAHLQRTVDHKLAFGRHLRALLRALGDTNPELASSARAGAVS